MAQAQHQAYLTNNNTGETVLIKSNDYVTFQSKIKQKEEQWKKQNELRNKQENKETMIRKALEMTKQAAQEIQDYRNILRHTLSIDDRIDWNTLFDKTAFKEYQPLLKPEKQEYEKSVPKETALEIFEFVKKRRLKALEKAEKVYSEAVENWELKEKERLLEY
ncbi:MAG TPA: hypothetical protein VN420_00280, partial [Candidatus Fimivivens sp.]|nr:hypothetical protein [Candidatus Fimivivens sp.]